MKSLLHIIEKFLGVYRWHPKIALRYLPIVKRIRNSRINKPRILEIGSGSLGIAPYLKKDMTGLDLSFPSPHFPNLKKVKGSALKVPFDNNSFDFVLMVDVLEHISKNDRGRVISEAIRVSNHEVVIAVPTGRLSEAEDRKLSKIYEKKFNKSFDFYKDHIQFGLPKEREIRDCLKTAAHKYNKTFILQTTGNVNIQLHYFLMRGWMTQNIIVDFIFRKAFILFIPVFRLMNFNPTYRKIFFVTFQS